ncbi:hypothetical protein V1512DRAFT_249288 [Lipomyces arxii]|uniref:uncharacterized protein n=1 Tax=Lipomyces arxii TaxID=56418 RepID=UPI0034CF9109
MDAELQARCEEILSKSDVLEEEQTDEVVRVIQDYYAAQGRVLASSDLEGLVLDALWRHRTGGVRAKTGGGPSYVGRVPVVRRFGRDVRTMSVESVSSTVSSTRTGSPEVGFEDEVKAAVEGFSPFVDIYDEEQPKQPMDEQAVSVSAVSSSSSPSTSVSSVSAITSQPENVSSTSSTSPFDHIRAGLNLASASSLTDADIANALESYGYDVLAAMTALMDRLTGRVVPEPVKVQTIGPAYSIEAPQVKDGPKAATVCRYFLTTGQCLRPDCRFTHDLSATVCRYWLQNSCLAGSTCVFLHSIPPELLAKLPEPQHVVSASQPVRRHVTLKDETEFPSLPSVSIVNIETVKKTVKVRKKKVTRWGAG